MSPAFTKTGDENCLTYEIMSAETVGLDGNMLVLANTLVAMPSVLS
jgi:hypothetical protein